MADENPIKYDISTAIPKLTGETNLSAWKSALINTLWGLDLDHYLEKTVPQPEAADKKKQWKKEVALVLSLLNSLIAPVRDDLLTAGLAENERDPFKIYSKVLLVVPKYSVDYVGALAAKFAACQLSDYGNTTSFLKDLQYMRRRMYDLKLVADDKLLLYLALDKIKDLRIYLLLQRDHKGGDLTWDKLVEEITAEQALNSDETVVFSV